MSLAILNIDWQTLADAVALGPDGADHARARVAAKRGGVAQRLPFDDAKFLSTDPITGIYHFNITGPGPWRVCEGTGPAGFVQTFPVFGGTPPLGETIVNTCPLPNIWGYEFTVTSGTWPGTAAFPLSPGSNQAQR